jgi:hypothetical protein
MVTPQGADAMFCSSSNSFSQDLILPTTSIYNATDSLARLENKNILFYFEKRYILLQRWRCSCKFKSRRIGSSY